jgi:hypothetical protein
LKSEVDPPIWMREIGRISNKKKKRNWVWLKRLTSTILFDNKEIDGFVKQRCFKKSNL